MKVLALETACMTASCAVVENGAVLGEISTSNAGTHSLRLVPMIEKLFDILELKADSIDLFSASMGPGSFTGLRIGIVTVKGMAYALKRPVCGIPTLDALAWSVNDFHGIVCPMLDARNNQVYTALYRKNEREFTRLTDYSGIPVGDLSAMLTGYPEDVLILGDAATIYFSQLKSLHDHPVFCADPALFIPRAACTALLAEKQAIQGVLSSAFELEPMYLRKSQAERMKDSVV